MAEIAGEYGGCTLSAHLLPGGSYLMLWSMSRPIIDAFESLSVIPILRNSWGASRVYIKTVEQVLEP
ncbi:hypothetical protein cyc_06368 [Cyclospora cayetanensis]|uniref:Uncharacterized protein n=1 Tax=Cyclospora cayetanensis TaxID=88456 RepID=A0A1D3D2Y1_9EIME|nr:hypothetical protein cyc_06368 [Cyclospora cayetanensis]